MFENADSPGSPMFVCATWYYQPREMGDAVEPSLKELKSAVFASKHADENDARTILRKIRVLPNYATYKKYRRKVRSANKAGRPSGSMKDVYFTAGRYDPLAAKVLQYDQTLRRLYIERRSGEPMAHSGEPLPTSSSSSSSSSTASSTSNADALWAAATEACLVEKGAEEVAKKSHEPMDSDPYAFDTDLPAASSNNNNNNNMPENPGNSSRDAKGKDEACFKKPSAKHAVKTTPPP